MIAWDRIAELQEEVGEDGLAEVIDLFFEELDESLESLGAGGDDLSSALHFMKGSALNIGLEEVAGLCRAAEDAARQGSAKIDLGAIQSAMAAARRELAALLPDPAP